MTDRVQTAWGSKCESRKHVQEDALPEEVEFEARRENFVRAAHLAVQNGVPREVIRQLQCKAVQQFIGVLHNFEGAKELISGYDLSFEELRTILRNVLDDPKSRTERLTCFNSKKGKMVAMTLAQRIVDDPMFRKYLC